MALSPSSSSRVDAFVKALERYSPSLDGLKSLSQAAADVGIPELRSASIGLQGLVQSGGMAGIGRFGSAPSKIYPTQSQVFGNLFAALSQSPNAGVKAFGAELAAKWLINRIEKGEVTIYGKYPQK